MLKKVYCASLTLHKCFSTTAWLASCHTLTALGFPAGLLLHGSDGKQEVGAGKSAVLLLSRLLMGSLFVFVGVTQIQRVIARDWVLHVQVNECLQRFSAAVPLLQPAVLDTCIHLQFLKWGGRPRHCSDVAALRCTA
jgi:hypothetical protein